MDEEVILTVKPGYGRCGITPRGIKALDAIKTDDNGYVLDEEVGSVPDIRKLPRKGGCGIGPDGASFEQVLERMDMTELQKREAKIAAEKKAIAERLAKEEAEVSRLRSLSEKELLVEICLLLKGKPAQPVEYVGAKMTKKKYDYDQWQAMTDKFRDENQILSGIK